MPDSTFDGHATEGLILCYPKIENHKPRATFKAHKAGSSDQSTAGLTEKDLGLPAQDPHFTPFVFTGLWINAGKKVSSVPGFNFDPPLNYAFP